MDFAFRVDASAEIGTGHLARCLTLADEIMNAGHSVVFICRYIPESSLQNIEKIGCKVFVLQNQGSYASAGELAHSSWLGVDQITDAEQSIEGLKTLGTHPAWLIVDHYALDFHWEKHVAPHTEKICVIDDLADRKHHCDLLVDQNFYKNPKRRYRSLVPPDSTLLLGPEYALLREPFKRIRASIKRHDGKIRRIVIFFGGSDKSNFTGRVIEILGGLSVRGLAVDVIIGELHPEKENIQEQCTHFGFFLHIQTSRIEDIFAGCDLCIGGGGVSTWERCCLGLPTLIVAIAMNQIQIARDLHDANGCVYLGDSTSVTEEKIRLTIEHVLSDPDAVRNISQTAFGLVDGLGVTRVMSSLSKHNEDIYSY